MKTAKLLRLFAPGILAALLSGCFNPITAIPSKTGDPAADPFTFDIMIGKDGSARTIAGPDANRIKYGGIRNIIQLIVVDMDDEAKEIVAFKEVRRTNANEKDAELTIESIPFGKNYAFLLLMGHWDHGGSYTYDVTKRPTLLAAGLKEQMVTGSGKVTVVMWPIVVDTTFKTLDGSLTTGPEVTTDGKLKRVSLLPVDWQVTWTLKKGTSGNGLDDLVRAQKVIPANGPGDELRVKSKTAIVRGDGLSPAILTSDSGATTTNIIPLPIGSDYTSKITRIGKGGSVYFNLEYVPFNLTDGRLWLKYNDKSNFDLAGKAPVWIIRNGVNDDAQVNDTDFNSLENGAVSFVVAVDEPDPADPQSGNLVIRDGKFVGPWNSTKPEITFITAGYTGTAEVYYAVVESGTDAPDYSGYTGILGSVAATTIPTQPELPVPHSKQITLPGTAGYDVYVRLFKDGKVSAAVKINTTAGGQDVNQIWGEKPYLLYVKADGRDTNSGDRDHPLATIQKALTNLKATYAASWPKKGEINEAKGGIIIMGEVPVTAQITIDNSNSDYPSIVLSGDPEMPGGKLQAMVSIGEGGNLLSLSNGVRVTLEGGLILAGTGNPEDKIRGVYVSNSTFTMNDEATIVDHAAKSGGGVYVNNGTFTMNDKAVISNNRVDEEGGGVYVNNGTFTMNDEAAISDNSAEDGEEYVANEATISNNTAKGGGVYVNNGIFTMNDEATISNNSAEGGGGVLLNNSRFTMNGEATIFDNMVLYSGGGGVLVENNSTVTMNNKVTISSNRAAIDLLQNHGGGVLLNNSRFTMNGEATISDNSARAGGGVYVNNGTFTMKDKAAISGNEVSVAGGGGYVAKGTFTMKDDATISGNTVFGEDDGYGGGIAFIANGGCSIAKEGGIIYGYEDGNSNSNVIKDRSAIVVSGYGHAVCETGGSRYKDTTLGLTDNLTYNYPKQGDSTGWN